MAYDVIKRINGREYRYRVQSERDPLTGKTRNRWTYVGRVSSERSVPAARADRAGTRARLLAAAERLLQRGDPKAITAGAIATEAGIAHGTFYRYFTDRSDVLRALAAEMRSSRGLAEDALRDDVATAGQARTEFARFIGAKMRAALDSPELMHVWYALIASDERLAAFRVERRAATIARLTEHFAQLTRRGFAQVDDPEATAIALFAMVDGIVRGAVLHGEPIAERHITAATDVAVRAVFG